MLNSAVRMSSNKCILLWTVFRTCTKVIFCFDTVVLVFLHPSSLSEVDFPSI